MQVYNLFFYCSENQPVDFEIELSLYSAKTSGGDGSQSLKQKLARSLSRKLGASYVSVLLTFISAS